MINRIREIQTDWKKPWLTATSFPRNLAGRHYCGSNALMLMLHGEKEGYEVPVYATFERIMSLNFDKDKQKLDQPTVSVQRGEKSFPVFLTMFTVVDKDTKEKIPYDDYKKLSDDEKSNYQVYPSQRVYNVFNVVSQTNIKEARPELYQKLIEEGQNKYAQHDGEMFSFKPVDEAIAKNAWLCPVHEQYQDSAFYRPSDKSIYMPEKEQFVDGESYLSTLFHESSHFAQDKLGIMKPSTFGDKDYSELELHAEMSAALVCQKLNISKTIKPESAAYLKSWLEHIDESPDYLKTVLNSVNKESKMILQRIDLIQEQIDSYQESQGRDDVYPDTYDINADGNREELVHEEKQSEIAAQSTPTYHRSR